MKTLKNSDGFSAIHALLILAVVGIVGLTGWYVWNSNNEADKNLKGNSTITAKPKGNSDVPEDEYAGWKTYQITDKSFSFKYPSDWYTKEGTLNRIYASNTQADFTKEDRPDNLQQIWFAIDSDEASAQNEDSVKSGQPQGREAFGAITTAQIKSGDLTIRTYEYKTVGGKTLQAFWTSKAGKRYYATNSTEVGEDNQQNMVNNLKTILATVKAN